MSEFKAGDWVESYHPIFSGYGQIIAHEETNEGWYVHGGKGNWGMRLKSEYLEKIGSRGAEPDIGDTSWAYPSWQKMVGGDGVNPAKILFEWDDLTFEDGKFLGHPDSVQLDRAAALNLASALLQYASAEQTRMMEEGTFTV